MCWKYNKSFVFHIDKHHHYIIFATVTNFIFMTIVSIIKGSFIAMMTVGNIELFIIKLLANSRNFCFICYNPKTMSNTIIICQFYFRLTCGKSIKCVSYGMFFVHIKRIYLTEIAVCSFHKLETVFLCL